MVYLLLDGLPGAAAMGIGTPSRLVGTQLPVRHPDVRVAGSGAPHGHSPWPGVIYATTERHRHAFHRPAKSCGLSTNAWKTFDAATRYKGLPVEAVPWRDA